MNHEFERKQKAKEELEDEEARSNLNIILMYKNLKKC